MGCHAKCCIYNTLFNLLDNFLNKARNIIIPILQIRSLSVERASRLCSGWPRVGIWIQMLFFQNPHPYPTSSRGTSPRTVPRQVPWPSSSVWQLSLLLGLPLPRTLSFFHFLPTVDDHRLCILDCDIWTSMICCRAGVGSQIWSLILRSFLYTVTPWSFCLLEVSIFWKEPSEIHTEFPSVDPAVCQTIGSIFFLNTASINI